MKIRATASVEPYRDSARQGVGKRAEARSVDAAATEGTTNPTAAAPATPARGPKGAPPGLERALARLQAIGEAERTPGQSMALDRIGRNLARYLENQGLATAPVGDAPVSSPEAPAIVVAAPSPATGEADAQDGAGSTTAQTQDAVTVPDEPAASATA